MFYGFKLGLKPASNNTYFYPEMASPYADALPDFAGPGKRELRQGARKTCEVSQKRGFDLKITYSVQFGSKSLRIVRDLRRNHGTCYSWMLISSQNWVQKMLQRTREP